MTHTIVYDILALSEDLKNAENLATKRDLRDVESSLKKDISNQVLKLFGN